MNDLIRLTSVPKSRIATFDVFSVGLLKHHVAAMLEFDVTEIRKELKERRRSGEKVSFNGWFVKAVSTTLMKHPQAAGFLKGKSKILIFKDINVSFLVEKVGDSGKVPIPLVIEKTNEKSAVQITAEIESANKRVLNENEIVLEKKQTFAESLYYYLPGFMRRAVWKLILRCPKFAFKKMGNVAVTSVGMMGKINGWFIHKSVHPVSFGVGSVIKKPVVINNEICIREILNVTVLFDHDVIDGAPMVRCLNDLTKLMGSATFFLQYFKSHISISQKKVADPIYKKGG